MKNFCKEKPNIFFWISIIIFCVLGTSMIFLSTKNYGVGVSPDSTHYIRQAEHIMGGDGFSTARWPPMYPAILAFCSLSLDLEILTTARMINIIFWGLTLLVSGLLLKRHLFSSKTLFLFGLFLIFFSPSLIRVYLMAWSESLFIFFAILFLFFIENYSKNRKSWILILSSICAALCSMTRYAGIALIFIGITIIVFLNFKNFKESIKGSLHFGLFSFSPILIWLFRNKIVLGTYTGNTPTHFTFASFLENLKAMINTILGWYLPVNSKFLAFLFIILIIFISIYYREILLLKFDISWKILFAIFISVYTFFSLITISMLFEGLICIFR